jgi:spore maturation protein CgeB
VILKPYWRGPGLTNDMSYSAAILAAKICLGLLSKRNRDLHTERSLEIPAMGGLLCAQRTSEHLALYEEGVDAVFWNDAAECAEICKDLLADEKRRREISRRGHERALRNNYFNQPVLASILEAAMAEL